MLIKYVTKRDINGHVKYLAVDHENKQYSRFSDKWIYTPECIQVRLKDLRQLESKAAAAGYSKVEFLG